MEKIHNICIIMGIIMVVIAGGLSVYWVMYSRNLIKTTGIITASHWEESGTIGSWCTVNVILPDGTEKICIAHSVSSLFVDKNYGKEVTCFVRRQKGNGTWLEECIVEDGSFFSTPGFRRVLIPVLAFLIVGILLIYFGNSIH